MTHACENTTFPQLRWWAVITNINMDLSFQKPHVAFLTSFDNCLKTFGMVINNLNFLIRIRIFQLHYGSRAGIAQLVVGRASAWSHTMGYHRSWSQAPPMLVCKYMDENGSAAMLAAKRSAGVTPEVNLKILFTQAMKHACEGSHPGFETQGRHHQKSKTGISVAPQKGLMSSNFFNTECNMEIDAVSGENMGA